MTYADRYRRFIARHEVAWELAFAGLAVLFVLTGFVPETAGGWVAELDLVLTVVFVAEFTSRLAVATDRRAYLRNHWVDALALIPTVRGVRILRLLRLLRLVRAFAGVGRALGSVQALASRQTLMWLFVAWGTVMVLSSLGLYAAEVTINDAINDPFDALWWGISTMTTVGYGDVYPQTPEGRLAAAVLMILGIGLYSAITATITSSLLAGRERRPRADDALRDLQALRDEGLITDAEFDAKRTEVLARI